MHFLHMNLDENMIANMFYKKCIAESWLNGYQEGTDIDKTNILRK